METTHATSALVKSGLVKFVLGGLLVIGSVLNAPANELPSGKGKEITVTAVGVENAEIVFKVKHLNSKEDKLYFALADKYGNKLYTETVSAKNFDKTFKINAEIGTVYLIVTNARTKAQEKFEISPRSYMVEDVSINSIN